MTNQNDVYSILDILYTCRTPLRKGNTRIQKISYLLGGGMGCPPTGGFSLYYYGPFSEEIEELLQTMHTTGLISFEEGDLMYLSRIGWDMIAKKGSIFGEKVAEKIRKWADMNLKDLIELACYEASERRRVTGVL